MKMVFGQENLRRYSACMFYATYVTAVLVIITGIRSITDLNKSFLLVQKAEPEIARRNSRPSDVLEPGYISITSVHDYNILINQERDRILRKMHRDNDIGHAGNTYKLENVTLANEVSKEYFQILGIARSITTIALFIKPFFPRYNLSHSGIIWTTGDNPRHVEMTPPDGDIYPVGFDSDACTHVLAFRNSFAIKNGTCVLRSSPQQTMVPIPSDNNNIFYQELVVYQQHYNDIFMHIIRNASVDTFGYVLHKNIYIMKRSCRIHSEFPYGEERLSKEWRDKFAKVDELFVSTHTFAREYYHASVETMSRIGPYLEFLRANPSVKILVYNTKELIQNTMRMAGIPPQRLVSGNTTGDIVYLPQGPGCIKVNAYGMHLIMKEYRDYIDNVMRLNKTRDTVILIHRTKKRFLVQHEDVKLILANLSIEFGLRFIVFSDLDIPTFNETIALFNRAVLVVGPHGAGLSNIMFSQPRTIVIEILCPNAHAIICYNYLAREAGHVYYGIRNDRFKDRKSCNQIWVDTVFLGETVRQYLDILKPKLLISP